MNRKAELLKTVFLGNLLVAILLGGLAASLHAQQIAQRTANREALPNAPGFSASNTPPESDHAAAPANATLSGTVLDTNGNVIQDGHVVLTNRSGEIERVVQSGANGQFTISGLPAGTYKLRITGKGMGTYVSPEITLHEGEMYIATQLVLPIAATSTEVTVYGDKEELAVEQVHIALQQRVMGVFPNFYSSYDWNAPPMGARQKFHLALRAEIDPINFIGVAGIAGAEQYQGIFPAFGSGIGGYAKRYAAAYANSFAGKMLGSAVFPSLFHQDPRYFYKGTGSTRSRALYALSAAVIARDDNGKWKPNYSHILGNFVAGAASNLYYPASSRGAALVVNTGLVETAMNAADNIIREFFLKGVTSHIPGRAQP